MTALQTLRLGAWCAVMQRITRAASPARRFLPGGRGRRSYVSSSCDGGY